MYNPAVLKFPLTCSKIKWLATSRTSRFPSAHVRRRTPGALMKTTLRLMSLFILCVLVCKFVSAQGAATGDLRVTVKDPRGSVVTNATVTVRDVAKGVERVGANDGEGGYSVHLLPPGTYAVTVEAPGFAKAEATG